MKKISFIIPVSIYKFEHQVAIPAIHLALNEQEIQNFLQNWLSQNLPLHS